MGDIELVIKIDEEMYASIHNGMRYTDDVRYIMDLIENATPLPKGHGKIGDIDKLYQVFKRNVACAKAFKDLFDNADTIIEADKGESE